MKKLSIIINLFLGFIIINCSQPPKLSNYSKNINNDSKNINTSDATEEQSFNNPTSNADSTTTTQISDSTQEKTQEKKTDSNIDNLLNPPEKKECDDKKLVYDRSNKKCLDIPLDMSWCSQDMIIQKFKNVLKEADKSTFETNFNQYLQNGYVIDQCGIKQNTSYPFITLYKKENENTLKIKNFEVK